MEIQDVVVFIMKGKILSKTLKNRSKKLDSAHRIVDNIEKVAESGN